MVEQTRAGRQPALVRLVGSGLDIADPAQDVRRRRVVTPSGADVGRIDALFVDPRRRRVRSLRVATGGVWGIGARRVLNPSSAVVRVDRDAVVIDRRRAGRPGRPAYDPPLTAERCWLDGHLLACAPFWARPLLDPVLAAPRRARPPRPGAPGASHGDTTRGTTGDTTRGTRKGVKATRTRGRRRAATSTSSCRWPPRRSWGTRAPSTTWSWA
jgi:hypothetical protein